MSRIQIMGGAVIELAWHLGPPTTPGTAGKVWHARIRGERLACCGATTVSAFHRLLDPEVDYPTDGEPICHGCNTVIHTIKLK